MVGDNDNQDKGGRRSQPTALSEVLENLLTSDSNPLAKSFLVWRVRARWAEIAGPEIARMSKPIGYRRQVLYLNVAHPAAIQQLTFMNRALVQKINEEVGKSWVKAIRYTTLSSLDGLTDEALKNLKKSGPTSRSP